MDALYDSVLMTLERFGCQPRPEVAAALVEVCYNWMSDDEDCESLWQVPGLEGNA